jgi:hypothetical protein
MHPESMRADDVTISICATRMIVLWILHIMAWFDVNACDSTACDSIACKDGCVLNVLDLKLLIAAAFLLGLLALTQFLVRRGMSSGDE